MAIPDYQSLMKPLLESIADGEEHRFASLVDEVASKLGVTEEERQIMLPSGRRSLFYDRLSWAKTYLAKAKLLESPGRGVLRITERGRVALRECKERLDNKYLMQFPEFRDFIERSRYGGRNDDHGGSDGSEGTPEEELSKAYNKIRSAVIEELQERIQGLSPRAFERLALDVLHAMGYGAKREQTRPGPDGGIDGVILQDRLGLEAVYVQAKRWTNPVGSPEVQKFCGAMAGVRGSKGVFITSSTFTEDAKKYVAHPPQKIVLIDGQELAELMFDFGVGVSTTERYEVKRLDSDYFNDLDAEFSAISAQAED